MAVKTLSGTESLSGFAVDTKRFATGFANELVVGFLFHECPVAVPPGGSALIRTKLFCLFVFYQGCHTVFAKTLIISFNRNRVSLAVGFYRIWGKSQFRSDPPVTQALFLELCDPDDFPFRHVMTSFMIVLHR